MSSINTSLLTGNKPATPILPSRQLTNGSATKNAPLKPMVIAPRIDVEPLYTALQTALGKEEWLLYKESVAGFILGNLNASELTWRISPLLSTSPLNEHLHNQFIAAIYGNTIRDPPEPGIATWVSSHSKSLPPPKTSASDSHEQRLKTEVMALTGRERRRLKQIKAEEPFDLYNRLMLETHLAKTIQAPDVHPTSAGGGANVTKNWELEIRKRYQQPLYSETHDFPDNATLSARLTPICYEEGLPSGAAQGCSEFLVVATEWFIKEVLSSFFTKTASNGPGFIRTGEFKRRLGREEEAWTRGEVGKNAAELLPCEVEENGRRRALDMQDLKICLELGDPYLGGVPLIAAAVGSMPYLDGDDDIIREEPKSRATLRPIVNGVNGTKKSNGVVIHEDAMDVDEPELSWQGASTMHSGMLSSLLDDCLIVGE